MLNEFEMEPVAPESLKSSKSFIASFAGEHVAGTEFVIGALFVSWGVSTGDLLIGLLIGNTLAVLTWALITAPIATDTRLTLYAYLEKIAGPGTIKVYSLVNGVLFCILAGAMVTVSASAVRVLFDLPAQVNWYPTDAGFVIVALTVGAVVSYIAMNGFTKVTRFAEVCAPWMILMFIIGAVISLPVLVAQPDSISQISNLNDLYTLAESYIWVESQSDIGLMHVAAFGGFDLIMNAYKEAIKKKYKFFLRVPRHRQKIKQNTLGPILVTVMDKERYKDYQKIVNISNNFCFNCKCITFLWSKYSFCRFNDGRCFFTGCYNKQYRYSN